MHEGNFTEQIVAAILQALPKEPVAAVQKVTVKVGEMLHLEPQSVRMHYRLLTHKTPLEKTELDLQEIPVRIRCNNCSREGGVEDHHLLICGDCGSSQVTLLEGDQVVIESIECQQV